MAWFSLARVTTAKPRVFHPQSIKAREVHGEVHVPDECKLMLFAILVLVLTNHAVLTYYFEHIK